MFSVGMKTIVKTVVVTGGVIEDIMGIYMNYLLFIESPDITVNHVPTAVLLFLSNDGMDLRCAQLQITHDRTPS